MAVGVVDALEFVHVKVVDHSMLAQRGEPAFIAAAVQKMRQRVGLLPQLGIENVDHQDRHRCAQPCDTHRHGLILNEKSAEEKQRQNGGERAVCAVVARALAQEQRCENSMPPIYASA